MDIRLANGPAAANYFPGHHYEPQLLASAASSAAYYSENSTDYGLYSSYGTYSQAFAPHSSPWTASDYANGQIPYPYPSPSPPPPPHHRGHSFAMSYDETTAYKGPTASSDLDSSGYCPSSLPSPTEPKPAAAMETVAGDHFMDAEHLTAHLYEGGDAAYDDENSLRNKNPTKANKKERRRTVSINSAFSNLRECIPNVPVDTKLSKIKTLRLATSYIVYLMGILDEDASATSDGSSSGHRNSGLEGFKVDLQRFKRGSKGENKALYQQKLQEEQERAKYQPRKGKGRTGWPQHVWADELKMVETGHGVQEVSGACGGYATHLE